jgi:hypothetical protein
VPQPAVRSTWARRLQPSAALTSLEYESTDTTPPTEAFWMLLLSIMHTHFSSCGPLDRNGVTVRFPEGGFQSIIIQSPGDGVSIDQVVLSSEKHLTRRPRRRRTPKRFLPQSFWRDES